MADNNTIQLKQGHDYLTLGQMLQITGVIDTGGQAKWYLSEYTVMINGEPENRRGKKLYKGDQIEVDGHGTFTVTD